MPSEAIAQETEDRQEDTAVLQHGTDGTHRAGVTGSLLLPCTSQQVSQAIHQPVYNFPDNGASLQILQQLSPHLTSAVLVATSTSLARCISLLPRQMHPLAVSAKCCSPLAQQDLFLSHQNSLTHNPSSSPLTAESASTQAREAQQSFKCDVLSAASSLTHITTLELSSSFMTGLKNNKALQQSLRALFTSLSGLSALVFQDGVTSACVDILVPVLSSMTAVQHLGIINPEPRDSSTCWFATRRHSASYMQAEGGWGNQADSEESDPDSAGALLPPNCEPDEVNTTTAPGADVHAVNTLIKHLRVLPALTSLTLAGAKPDCSQVVAFCSALKQLTGLRGLVMTDCFVHRGSEAVGDGLKVTQRLGGALKKLKLLERLDLQGSLPGDIIDPILDSIAGLTHLSHLCMQSVHSMSAVACPLPHRVAADSAGFGRRLAPMLSKLKSLQFLDLSECYIPTSTMGDVVNAIAGLTCLTGLELQQISREECFWEYFSEKVTSLVDLEDLIVSMNPCITDANVGKLAESLAKLPKLQDLDMHCCRVGKVGASALAQHLTGMKALKTLRLQMNRIRPEGAQVLAECFKTMTQLQEVSLLDSDIGDEGERVIVGALEESRGPEWQGEMSLSVMEDNKDLRRYYFQTGLDWYVRLQCPENMHAVFTQVVPFRSHP